MSKGSNAADNAPDSVAGLSYSQVFAAGIASAGAAVLTSRFGVTGTLLGAALTTMIITGGSVVLKNYLEKVSGHVQSIGAKKNRRASKAPHPEPVAPPTSNETSEGMAVYGRRRNLFGGMRRRSVFVGALIPALLTFGIAIAAVTGVELTGGRTLSCLVWDECGVASTDGSNEGSRTSLGVLTGDSSRNVSSETRQDSGQNSQQTPTQDSGIFGNDNSDNSGTPTPEEVVPVTPGGESDSDYDSGTPGTGTPGTGTPGTGTGADPSEGVEPGTGIPEEETPDYETPPIDSSGGMEQAPAPTPTAPSSRSSDAGATPPTATE